MTLPCLDLSNTDTSSASEDEGSLRRQGRLATSTPYQGHGHPAVEHWFNRVIQGSSTSSSASSTSSHPGGRSVTTTNTTAHAALNANAAATALADLMAHTQLGQWHTQPHTPSHFGWQICMFLSPFNWCSTLIQSVQRRIPFAQHELSPFIVTVAELGRYYRTRRTFYAKLGSSIRCFKCCSSVQVGESSVRFYWG